MSAGLLDQIEAGVVSGEPLNSLLRKCVMLGARAGSEKLREWALQELNGYKGLNAIPEYRRLRGQISITFTNPWGLNARTESFSITRLSPEVQQKLVEMGRQPEMVPIGSGIGEIEAMAAQGKEEHHLLPYWAEGLLPFLTNNGFIDTETTRIERIYWTLANTQIEGLLDRVRTKLAELIGELISLTPSDQQPTKEAADAVAVYIINGDKTIINNLHQDARGGTATAVQGNQAPAIAAAGNSTAIGSQIASGEGATVVGSQTASGEGNTVTGRDARAAAAAEPQEGFFKRWRKRGIFVGIATVAALGVAIADWLGWTPW